MASKYNAQPTWVDGTRFASKKEAARYGELKNLERAQIISGLTLQPKFPLIVQGKQVCTYIGDFAYLEGQKFVVEDVKGFKTDVYKLKRRLLLALQPGLDHREVGIQRKRGAKAERITREVAQIFREAKRGRT